MAPAALKALILSQPAGSPVRAAYAGGNDVETARLLRLPADPLARRSRACSVADFVNALYDLGLWSVVQGVAANTALPPPLRDACTRIMRLEQSPHFDTVQPARVTALIGAFEAANLVTAGQKAAILSLFSEPDPTPVAACTADDVYRTRSLP